MNANFFGAPGPDVWIRIRGRTIGSIVCFGFGAYSLYCWIAVTSAEKATWFYMIAAVTAVLVLCAIVQLVAMRGTPQPTMRLQSKWAYNLKFFAVVAMEVAAIILGGPILAHFHRSDLYSNWVGAVVGIHFLPLARLFKVPLYYVTGGAIALAALGSLLISQNSLRTGLCSGGAGLVLWLTGGLILYANLACLPAKNIAQAAKL